MAKDYPDDSNLEGTGVDTDQRLNQADRDGQFRRQASLFRDVISDAPDSKFKPEKGRYLLYVCATCPWVSGA